MVWRVGHCLNRQGSKARIREDYMMENDKTSGVVVAVDGTAGSQGALRYGVDEAEARGCEVRLVHVAPRFEVSGSIMRDAKKQIEKTGLSLLAEAEQQAKALSDRVEVSTQLRIGSRIQEILAAGSQAELLVLGRPAHTDAQRLVFGSTTGAVVGRSMVPTSVIPTDWVASPTTARVVVGLRSAEHTDELLQTAFDAAVASSAAVDVVHAWKMPDPYIDSIQEPHYAAAWMTAGTEMVEHTLEPWRVRYPDVAVNVRVVHDHPARALLVAAEGATMLLLLRRRSPKLLGSHLGATARAVLGSAQSPVNVLPHSQDGDDGVKRQLDLGLERSGAPLK